MSEESAAPATETPVAETPAAETPAVETPVVEAPAAEAPVVEAPAAEAPVVEAPAVKAPVETPAVALAAGPHPAAKGPGGYIWGTGRRKSAVARVRIRPGGGTILINKRPMEEYFVAERDRQAVLSPLAETELTGKYDVWVNVKGGGPTGQADATLLGVARALFKAEPDKANILREKGLMTRDARMKERKKPGQPGARKRFQFSKR